MQLQQNGQGQASACEPLGTGVPAHLNDAHDKQQKGPGIDLTALDEGQKRVEQTDTRRKEQDLNARSFDWKRPPETDERTGHGGQ